MLKNIKKLNPDVLLIDLMLPGMSGIEGIKKVKSILPGVRIIVLTVYSENDLIFDALCAGASGYIAKNTPQSKLLYSLKEAYEGGTAMSSNIARKVIRLFRQKGIADNGKNGNSIKLTQREEEILNKLVEGSSFKAIADSLKVNVGVLRSDFENIYEKLHSVTKPEAV
jgi:DNA-binding NarL/FixJ family response regulator